MQDNLQYHVTKHMLRADDATVSTLLSSVSEDIALHLACANDALTTARAFDLQSTRFRLGQQIMVARKARKAVWDGTEYRTSDLAAMLGQCANEYKQVAVALRSHVEGTVISR